MNLANGHLIAKFWRPKIFPRAKVGGIIITWMGSSVYSTSTHGHTKRTMSIFKYFTKKDTALPSLKVPLSAVVPPDAVRSMNREVKKIIEQSGTEKRESVRLTSSQRVLIRKRAAEHGVTSLIRHFSRKYSNFSSKETTLRHLKNECLAEIRKRRCKNTTGANVMTELPSKKRGRLTLLEKELEERE